MRLFIFLQENVDDAEKTIGRKRTVRRFNYATNKRLKQPPKVLEEIDLSEDDTEPKMLVFFKCLFFL